MTKRIVLLTAVSMLALAGCGSLDWFSDPKQKPLEGERLSLYDFEKTLRSDPNTQFGLDGSEEQTLITLADVETTTGQDDTMVLAEPWDNNFWPQVGGYPNHTMKHVAFTDQQPSRLWSRSIGSSSSNRAPLTAAPIVALGKVFTLDTDSRVQATDAKTGAVLWAQNVRKSGEDESVIGGGLAYSAGRVFVTNGFNEIVALNPENGAVLWRTLTKSPIRGAPAAVPGRVFVITMDNKTLAFNSENGSMLWQHAGLVGDTSMLGASTPAIDNTAVITAYSSGEIYALRVENGQELWGENLAPIARAAGRMQMADIRALPVIESQIVYATSHANRTAAIDLRTGMPFWNAAVGSSSTPWVSGNRLYMVGLQGHLVSMDRTNGKVLWQSRPLSAYEDDPKDAVRLTWQGPILAGNRLMVFASDGRVFDFDPVDGSLIHDWSIGGSMRLSPAIANETLYVVDENGTLSAWK